MRSTVEEKRQAAEMEQEFLDWQERQLLLRKKYCFTPAGFGDSFDAVCAETRLREAQQEYQKRKIHCFLSVYEPQEEGFVGRKNYLDRMKAALELDKPIILYGIGGIGKTALARAFIRKVQKTQKVFDKVIFLSYNTGLEALICDDSQMRISNMFYSRDKYGSKSSYFREKLKVLQDLTANTRILIVIDDFNVEKDRRMKEIFSLPCHFLVTTRMNPQVWERELFAEENKGNKKCFTSIEVKEFDTEKEWSDFIQLYQKQPFTKEQKEDLFSYRNRVHGHTLFMMLKIRGIDAVGKESFREEEEEIAKDLFRRFHLSKNEKQALCELSIMPVQGIEEELYYKLSKVSAKTVKGLADRLLVRHEAGWLSLHPMIAAAVQNVFRPGQKAYRTYVERMHGLTFHAWNQTYLDNQKLEPYVFAILKMYPKPFYWQYREYDAMITFLWIQGYFDEANHYCSILLKTTEKHYGINHQVTGEMTLRMAAVYYNAMNFEKAHYWYVEAYKRLVKSEPFDNRYAYVRSSASGKLAREYRYRGELKTALRLIEEALEIVEMYEDNGRPDVEGKSTTQCHWMLGKARILWDMGRFQEAWKLGNKARNMIYKISDETRKYEVNEFDRFLLKMILKYGEYEAAENLACSMAERSDIFRQQFSKDALSNKEHLADVWMESGKCHKAEAAYENILEILKDEYPYQKEWISRVQEKLKSVKSNLIAEDTPHL